MTLVYSNNSFKKLKRIGKKDLPKIRRKINEIKENPLSGKLLQGSYKGEYSVRAWPLRIVYTFDSDMNRIEIIDIDYRGRVYRN